MRDDEKRPLVGVQIVLEPGNVLDIEKVRRLVEKHQIGLFEQEPRKHELCSLSARKLGYRRIVPERPDAEPVRYFFDRGIEIEKSRVRQSFEHGIALFDELFELRSFGFAHAFVQLFESGVHFVKVRKRFEKIFHYAFRTVYIRVLVEITAPKRRIPLNDALILHEPSRKNVYKRRLSRTVKTHNTDMLSVHNAELCLVEQHSAVEHMGQIFYFEYAHVNLFPRSICPRGLCL